MRLFIPNKIKVDRFTTIKGGAKVIYDRSPQGERRVDAIKLGFEAHRGWAKACETVKQASDRLVMAKASYVASEPFIWFKYPTSLFNDDGWTVYNTETAPEMIIEEYKSFWMAVIGVYENRLESLK